MRMIEQFAAALGRILFNKKTQQTEQIQDLLNQSAKQFLGLDLELLHNMSVDDIRVLFDINDNPDLSRYFIAAEVLRTEAELMDDPEKNKSIIYDSFLKAFTLYYKALQGIADLRTDDNFKKMNALVSYLRNYHLSADLKISIMKYYELAGDYADAENVLYELLEEPDIHILAEARGFYQRLLKKSDSELNAGNLPRSEILEGLEKIRLHE